MMSKRKASEYVAVVGIDWAEKKHYFHCQGRNGEKLWAGQIINDSAKLYEWAQELRRHFSRGTVAICLEQSHGSLIYFLMQFDWMHLFPVNPATISRFREAFAPSFAKSDPADAEIICEVMGKHRDKLRRWIPDDDCTRKLDQLCQSRRKRVDRRTSVALQLISLLKTYFPEAMGLVSGKVTAPVLCNFVQKWPTPGSAKSATEEELRRFFHQNNCRNASLIESRIKTIKALTPVTKDKAIVEVGAINAQMLCSEIAFLTGTIRRLDLLIDKEFMGHQDAEIFSSLPGGGKVNAPKLAVAFGTDRDRFDSAQAISTYGGIAPVIESSGKQRWVHMRRQAPVFKKQTFHEFAACSINYSRWAKAYYQMKRKKGFKHQATVRALAYKWNRIIFRCWQENKPYDEERYIAALKKSGSPIVKYIKNSEVLS